MIDSENMYRLCNQHKWFTAGSNEQYEKLFQLVDDGATPDQLALVIWVCSDGFTYKEILKELAVLSLL